MYELLSLVFAICIFKKGPQDLPASRALIYLLALIYVGVSFLILIVNVHWVTAISQVLVELVLMLGLCWAILRIAKKPARYQQAVCALIATDAFISFLALPSATTLAGQDGAGLALIFVVLLMIWHWLIAGHIFSRALSQPMVFGLGVAFMYQLTSYQVIGALFPKLMLAE